MYLITSFIPGTPLKIATFLESSTETRAAFYSQIIDVLAELSQLEFPAICSLMPEGRFIGPLSPSLNERRQTLPVFTSAAEYMKAQWENIKKHAEILDEDLTEEDIRDEMFVLHHLEPYFHELSPTNHSEKGPFVLSHPDFRCGNTIVDENMNIQGIIDWEFASTIPRSLLSPPSWITNHDGHIHLQFAMDKLYNQFVSVLEEKSKHNSVCAQLQKEWFEGVANRTSNAFRIAYLVRWPGEISHTFLDFFRSEILGDESQAREKETEFFQQRPHLVVETRRRFERSDEYARYLKDNGLYEEDENQLALNKLQSELDAKTDRLGMDRIILR
ncbi:hypothetical protein J3459_017823 [Metarhizium acridum]|uniref:uncharacterized protein n=1 Tax=Metarhizium acridum TaxID=92637 RepID=UPI001C6C1EAF|nr:hypothetical protein J3459_017823 [Metarhizium acridum]KAG8410399.1 hypothetical protein J3458_017723 [Metarhizium acridum]